MARYYFDLQFGEVVYNDVEGKVLKRPGDAFREMAETLLEVGREVVVRPGQPDVTGIVRDQGGVLWRGRLSLDIQKPRRSDNRAA